jgi:carotenoid 1,2-hydratase
MTERGRKAVERTSISLQIGPSSLNWQDDTLVIAIDEVTAPIPRRARGTIRVSPLALPARSFALDGPGRHVWQPIAPLARISVQFKEPALNWTGNAYLDSNYGVEPLESGFKGWTWSRAHRTQDSIVLYDAMRRDGSQSALALRFKADGTAAEMEPLPHVALPTTGWRLARHTRADAGSAVRVRQTLENAPFYARSLLDTQLYRERSAAFHESLSLDRFSSALVRAILPFRMPRRFL